MVSTCGKAFASPRGSRGPSSVLVGTARSPPPKLALFGAFRSFGFRVCFEFRDSCSGLSEVQRTRPNWLCLGSFSKSTLIPGSKMAKLGLFRRIYPPRPPGFFRLVPIQSPGRQRGIVKLAWRWRSGSARRTISKAFGLEAATPVESRCQRAGLKNRSPSIKGRNCTFFAKKMENAAHPNTATPGRNSNKKSLPCHPFSIPKRCTFFAKRRPLCHFTRRGEVFPCSCHR